MVKVEMPMADWENLIRILKMTGSPYLMGALIEEIEYQVWQAKTP